MFWGWGWESQIVGEKESKENRKEESKSSELERSKKIVWDPEAMMLKCCIHGWKENNNNGIDSSAVSNPLS